MRKPKYDLGKKDLHFVYLFFVYLLNLISAQGILIALKAWNHASVAIVLVRCVPRQKCLPQLRYDLDSNDTYVERNASP